MTSDPLRYTIELAERVNCSEAWTVAESAGLLQCLKQLPYQDLIQQDIRRPKYVSAFGPTIDRRSVLPSDVRSMMSKLSDSVFSSTAFLVALSRREGVSFLTQRDLSHGVPTDRMRRMLRTYMQNVFDYHRQSILDILTHQYSDWERPQRNDPASNLETLVDLLGDGQLIAPIVELAQYHAKHAPAATYFCIFNVSPRPDAYPRWATGAHGDDLPYVFGAPLVDGIQPFGELYSRTDRAIAEAVLRYWTNFIKTGSVVDSSHLCQLINLGHFTGS